MELSQVAMVPRAEMAGTPRFLPRQLSAAVVVGPTSEVDQDLAVPVVVRVTPTFLLSALAPQDLKVVLAGLFQPMEA